MLPRPSSAVRRGQGGNLARVALEERLELDVADALRSVDTIEAALERAAQTFKVALADALDLLGSVAVTEVDARAVTTSIEEAAALADPEVEVEATASSTAWVTV